MFNLHATIYISKPHCALYLLYQRGSNMGSYSIHVKGIRLDLIIVFHLRIWNPTKRNGVDQLIIWDCDQLAVADWVELKSVDRTTNSISIWERAQKYLFILILIQFFFGGGVGGVGGVNHLSWPHICNIQNLSWKNTKRKKVVSFLVSMLLSVWFVLPNLRKTRAFDEKMRACIETGHCWLGLCCSCRADNQSIRELLLFLLFSINERYTARRNNTSKCKSDLAFTSPLRTERSNILQHFQ